MTVKRIFQKEPVLSIATCLALISAFIVHPDTEYFSYIDFRTLAILFSLMTVMAGLRGQGVFWPHPPFAYPHHVTADYCPGWPLLFQQYAHNKRCIIAYVRSLYFCCSE